MAGLGSLQSTERRWYQRRRPSWMCADLMLGSKRCTSQPLLAMLTSNWLSSLPSLRNKQDASINASKRPAGEENILRIVACKKGKSNLLDSEAKSRSCHAAHWDFIHGAEYNLTLILITRNKAEGQHCLLKI